MTHILIVNARFYTDIADELKKGAAEALQAAGVSFDSVAVPGAFEIPAAIRFAMLAPPISHPLAVGAKGGRYDGYVALGCVIRGETTHYDYVCGESARGLMDLSIQFDAAIGYGILTVENEAQAWERADRNHGDKGGFAANTCLAMIELKKKFGVRT